MKLLVSFFAVLFVSTAFTLSSGYNVGDKVKDFNLKNVDGKMVSLESYEDAKGYIVVFTCNSCPYSVAYEDRIIDLHKDLAPKGFPVIAINPNDVKKSPKDSYDLMIKRAKEKDFPFAYVYDESQEVTKEFGATNTPHVYVLDKDMVVRYIGAIDNNTRSAADADKKYVREAVESIIKNEEISNNKTKAIGCTIKWAS